jgi:hypothetical protein
MYTKCKQHILDGDIDFNTDTIRAILVDSASYTPTMATDEYLDDVPSGARKGNSGGSGRTDGAQLTSPTITNGVFDAANTTLTSVSVGGTYEYILVYKDDGSAEATSPIILLIDTAASGLPVTPNGADITIAWDDGAYKIFSL